MQTTFKSIADLKSSIMADPELQKAFADDPKAAAESIQETPLDTDVWIYRIVVITLGISIISIIIGVLLLIRDKQEVPAILTAIGSAAIGALSGLLAPSPKNSK